MRLSNNIPIEYKWKVEKKKTQPFLFPCLSSKLPIKIRSKNINMQSKRKKILMIDDEPDILKFLQVILKKKKYLVLTSQKTKYLEQLHNKKLPDLILLDILLSNKNNQKIIKYLKQQKK